MLIPVIMLNIINLNGTIVLHARNNSEINIVYVYRAEILTSDSISAESFI